jgi:hypothetical protein
VTDVQPGGGGRDVELGHDAVQVGPLRCVLVGEKRAPPDSESRYTPTVRTLRRTDGMDRVNECGASGVTRTGDGRGCDCACGRCDATHLEEEPRDLRLEPERAEA